MANWKRKYWKTRKEFKQELYDAAKDNPIYIPMIFETYTASRLRDHIHKIWYISRNYPDFREEYNRELFGKMLTGRDEMLRNLCYADERFCKYVYKTGYRIPERLAMGDALAVAYKIQKEKKKEREIPLFMGQKELMQII